MVLTTAQIEMVTQYLAKIQFLQIKLKDVVYPTVLLNPTLDTQIAAKDAEIGEARKLSGIESWNYDKYVSIVMPLKKQLYVLKSQNSNILEVNRILILQAATDYKIACAPKLDALNNTKNAFIDYLRSIEAVITKNNL